MDDKMLEKMVGDSLLIVFGDLTLVKSCSLVILDKAW